MKFFKYFIFFFYYILVSAVMKKGVLMEARDYEMEFEILNQDGTTGNMMKIKVKASHVKITVEKE